LLERAADPCEQLLQARVPRIGEVGDHRRDGDPVAAPAEDVLENRLIPPEPREILDEPLRAPALR
jgi:hypothetical protein